MQTNSIFWQVRVALATAVLALVGGHAGHAMAAVIPGTVDLTVTPPDLTVSVDPNIVVSFDDSGSMARSYMGDQRPFDSGSWGGPWRCAAIIDPRATSGIKAHVMNGVYYNPNILYTPPTRADGSAFPQADASLAAVWQDGIYINRPTNPGVAGAVNNRANPDGASGSDATGTTQVNGTKSGGNDYRWKCGYNTYPTAFVGGENINNGGPYYYRLKSTVSISVDGAGNPTSVSTLYDANNWEAVRIPNTAIVIDGVSVNQWQNFANWFAYYRTRSLMTRTALSRVFSQFGSNIRVAWQTIGCPSVDSGEFGCAGFLDDSGVGGTVLKASSIITNLSNTNPAALNYRNKFFDFLFSVPASINTPNRRATMRAGMFYRRPNTSDLKNPYWQPADPVAGTPARELSCRQNFHMLVTDGYWNESTDPTLPPGFINAQTSRTLPDGKAFSSTAAVSRVFWNVQGSAYPSSLANIAFNYWAQDLRPDLPDNVPAYYPNKTTGITGSTPLPPGADPANNQEIYFNPANDPATWQHVVQFMVTLGVSGKLSYSDDANCDDVNSDMCKLRKGQSNSSGAVGWTRPVNNAPEGIDDTWHAAVNSRGSYFSAGNPQQLVSHLTQIIANVLVRSSTSTAAVTSLPFQTIGNAAFGGSYDSGDWSGRLLRMVPYDAAGNAITPPTIKWDAGCTLTGGTCPDGTKTAQAPGSRIILTSDGANHGKAFRWADLNNAQRALLNANPTRIAASSAPANWLIGPDNFGSQRVDYLRGARTYESPGSASDPQFRRRGSVLGAIINSQPVYNASAASGWFDLFPAGSPEDAVVDTSADYQHFVDTHKTRAATVYVGANDGMLHAFNAVDGSERWAFVPNTLITNGNLTRITDKSRGLTPAVDSQPTVQDVFINGQWRTVLVGALRLGGRGIYALDITNPAGVTEANAAATVMWEFNNLSTGGANLGYTFGRPNVVRLNNGKWAVLVSSGYFPNGPVTDSYDDPASNEAAANKTSLFVIDLESGNLIRELKTSTAPQAGGVTTFGLSQPGVYDLGNDQVDDVAVAGDLAGNAWRFDLSAANPVDWKVDLLFKSYPSTANNGASGTCDAFGKCPITVMPIGMRNPAARGIVWIFGTGKYIGKSDRSSNIPAQSFYGIYDLGLNSPSYPITPSNLNKQKMIEQTIGTATYRFVSSAPVSTVTTPLGWTLPLDLAAAQGERNVVTGSALDTSNRIILATLIPTTSDPCTPGRKGALIVLDAASGNGVSVIGAVSSPTTGYNQSGVVDISGAIPSSGDSLPVTSPIGGGGLAVLGVNNLAIPDNYWFRTAWRRLLDML